MTASFCLLCGAMKVGAFTWCDECEFVPPDWDVALQFTDDYLNSLEVNSLRDVVMGLAQADATEEERYWTFLYFVTRKWPKILEVDIDKLENDLRRKVESLYQEHLADHIGQHPSSLRQTSRFAYESWNSAVNEEMQRTEDAWRDRAAEQAPALEKNGAELLEMIRKFIFELGQGGIASRILFPSTYPPPRKKKGERLNRASEITHCVKEHGRRLDDYCEGFSRGWSGKTRRQVSYTVGTKDLLAELAAIAIKLASHVGFEDRLIPMKVRELRQELKMKRRTYESTAYLAFHPEHIEIDAHCAETGD